MKKYSAVLIFVLCSIMAHAQGNLQFNRVVTIADSSIVTTPTSPGIGYIAVGGTPVPAGKVWKIEAYSIYGLQNGSGGSIYTSLGVNYTNLGFSNSPVGASGSAPIGNGASSSTIWLKANDVLNVCYWELYGNTIGVTGSVRYFFSIIEFNIVP